MLEDIQAIPLRGGRTLGWWTYGPSGEHGQVLGAEHRRLTQVGVRARG
jgi:hypothetical protein